MNCNIMIKTTQMTRISQWLKEVAYLQYWKSLVPLDNTGLEKNAHTQLQQPA